MKTRFLVLLIFTIVLSSCKKEVKNNSSGTTEVSEINLLDTLSLKLNNGDKWIVNKATLEGVTKMDSIINSFKSNNEENYISLGQSLSKQTSYIIKSCDMTGEAHDQLHVILVPMLDKISNLKESTNTTEGKSSLIELEVLIKSYFRHFKYQ